MILEEADCLPSPPLGQWLASLVSNSGRGPGGDLDRRAYNREKEAEMDGIVLFVFKLYREDILAPLLLFPTVRQATSCPISAHHIARSSSFLPCKTSCSLLVQRSSSLVGTGKVRIFNDP